MDDAETQNYMEASANLEASFANAAEILTDHGIANGDDMLTILGQLSQDALRSGDRLTVIRAHLAIMYALTDLVVKS